MSYARLIHQHQKALGDKIMSDIFDHELDAYESLSYMYESGDFGVDQSYAPPDPLFYHIKIHLAEPPEAVGKAYKLKYLDEEIMVPQSICKNRNDKEKTIYVHKKIFFSIAKKQAESKKT